MITARLLAGIRDHFPARASEWHMVYPCLGIGMALHLDPQLFSTAPAYASVARWMAEEWWALLFLACAAMRLSALVVNGTFLSFTHSPAIRLAVALISGFAWGQLCLGFYLEWLAAGKATFLTICLSHLVLVECLNAFRSSRDMAAVERRRKDA